MKRTIFLVMAVLAIFAIVSCDNGSETKKKVTTYTVTFEADGGTPAPAPQTVEKDKFAAEPAAMTKADHAFIGWRLDGVSTNFNFASTPITANIKLYAIWLYTGGVALEDIVQLSLTYSVSNNENQKGWASTDMTGEDIVANAPKVDWDDMKAANYLVLTSKGSSNRDGFGGLQVVIQGDGNNYNWDGSQTTLWGDWLTLANGLEDTVTFAIDLTKIPTWDEFITGTKGKIIICYYPLSNLGLETASLFKVEYPKPTDTDTYTIVDFDDDLGFAFCEIYVPGEGEEELYTITFDKNGGSGDDIDEITQANEYDGIDLPKPNWTKNGAIFNGWALDANGTALDAVNYVPEEDTTLYATYVSVTGAEKLELTNAFYAIYRFEMPDGTTWQDYSTLTVDYLFTSYDFATARERNARVMGPYKESDFALYTGDDEGTAPGKNLAIASYNNGKNAEYILDGGLLGNDSAPGALKNALSTKASITATGGEWFTYDKYVIDKTKANASYVSANYPADDFNGVLYFGIGLPAAGSSDPANIQYVKNVKLVSYAEDRDILGTPLLFVDTDPASDTEGVLFPAFSGYPTTDGTNGYAQTNRVMADGSQSFAIPTTEDVELVNLNNAWYVVYEFVIPDDKVLGTDYNGFSVDYLFTEEHLATARERNGRLMGPYLAEDFTFFTGTDVGSAPGKKLAVANYNGGKNAEYILDGGKLGNSSDPGSLKTALSTKASITATGGQWFTYDVYDVSGDSKNGSFTSEHLTTAQALTDVTVYFGIGFPSPGASDPANVQYIRNVTLKGYDESDDIIGVPAYLRKTIPDPENDGEFILDDDDEYMYPVFTGYNTPDGTNGFLQAYRLKGTR